MPRQNNHFENNNLFNISPIHSKTPGTRQWVLDWPLWHSDCRQCQCHCRPVIRTRHQHRQYCVIVHDEWPPSTKRIRCNLRKTQGKKLSCDLFSCSCHIYSLVHNRTGIYSLTNQTFLHFFLFVLYPYVSFTHPVNLWYYLNQYECNIFWDAVLCMANDSSLATGGSVPICSTIGLYISSPTTIRGQPPPPLGEKNRASCLYVLPISMTYYLHRRH